MRVPLSITFGKSTSPLYDRARMVKLLRRSATVPVRLACALQHGCRVSRLTCDSRPRCSWLWSNCIGAIMNFFFQPSQLLVLILAAWINREQHQVIEYLRIENQILREKIGKRRILLNDDQRRRLAVKGKVLGRKL